MKKKGNNSPSSKIFMETQYLNLLKDVLEKGNYKPAARENMPGTYSLFGHQMRHNLQEGFPLLTTKKIYWKGVVIELLWFLKGDTNIKYLVDNGCNIWNEDQQNFVNRNNWTEEGSLGYQYPWLWRSWGKEDRKWQPKPKLNIKFPLETASNNTKSKKVGNIIKTNSYGDVLVLDYIGKNLFKVQFQNTGTIVNVSSSSLIKGEVRDIYAPDVLGIACCGRDNNELNQKIRRKLYVTWQNILKRCYDKEHLSYKNYGGKGKFVDNRWLCFEYFVTDVIQLKGWDNKLSDWNNYHLDKDLIGRGFVYSKNDCIWLHKNDNLARNERTTYFTFKNQNSQELFTTNNIREFGRKYNLGKNFDSVGTYLSRGKMKSYKGWELIKTEDISNKGIDQIKELIDGLKNNPMSRRHILTAWNPATLNDMALHPCHVLIQFNVRENKNATDGKYYLDCQLYQRSADLFLGVPFNIASYSLLTIMVAQVCGFQPGEFIHTFGDVHLYSNHLDAAKEQLKREPRELPTLKITSDITNELLWKELDYNNFEIINYNPHPSIKAEVSTGLKNKHD